MVMASASTWITGTLRDGVCQCSVVVLPTRQADEQHQVGLRQHRAVAGTPPLAPTTPTCSGCVSARLPGR
jgi:hypothetical protein